MAVAFQLCESHPRRPLTDHLVDVANRIRAARPRDQLLFWVALFHDLGKATTFFQSYLHGGDAPRDLRAHAQFGAMWLLSFLLEQRHEDPTISIIDVALAHLFVRRLHGRLDDLSEPLASRNALEATRLAEQMAATDVPGLSRWLGDLTRCFSAPQPTQPLIRLS